MFFDSWFVFFSETYLFLAVCSGLNLYYYPSWQGLGDSINTFFAILFGSVLLALIPFVIIFYNINSNFNRLVTNDKWFMASFGTMFSGLNFLRRRRLVLVYFTLSLFRKLWLAHIVVAPTKNPTYAIF